MDSQPHPYGFRLPEAETSLMSPDEEDLPHGSEATQRATASLYEIRPQENFSIETRLYVSHFLSTWNSRVFEFGAILFIASIFPGTLLPTSSYALVRAASAAVVSPFLGSYIDENERLPVIRASIGEPFVLP